MQSTLCGWNILPALQKMVAHFANILAEKESEAVGYCKAWNFLAFRIFIISLHVIFAELTILLNGLFNCS